MERMKAAHAAHKAARFPNAEADAAVRAAAAASLAANVRAFKVLRAEARSLDGKRDALMRRIAELLHVDAGAEWTAALEARLGGDPAAIAPIVVAAPDFPDWNVPVVPLDDDLPLDDEELKALAEMMRLAPDHLLWRVGDETGELQPGEF